MSARPVAIIQARMGSSRLSGKMVMDLDGEPVLAHAVRAARACPALAAVVVATTDRPEDDLLAATAAGLGAGVYRGSAEDVLARFIGAAEAFAADPIVRLTGDNPLITPETIAAVLARFSGGDVDYACTFDPPSYPDGLEVEVLSRAALDAADQDGTDLLSREHVTIFIRRHPERFRLVNVQAPPALRRPDVRLTLDTPEDLAWLREACRAVPRCGAARPLEALIAFWDARHAAFAAGLRAAR